MQDPDYELRKNKFKKDLSKYNGRIYSISHSGTKRIVHLTIQLYAARALLDQLFSSLRVSIHHSSDVPSSFDINTPWTSICDAHARIIAYDHGLNKDKTPYHLLSEKYWAIECLMQTVNRLQVRSMQGELPFQSQVYQCKAAQARKILDGLSTDFNDTYYVHSYSQLHNISLEQAAAEIMFKHEESDIFLYQIDVLRIKYQKRIREETNINHLPAIINEFNHECNTYASI